MEHPLDGLGEEELEALKERFRQMALLLTGYSDVGAECSYCHGTVDLGEALLTMNLCGVLAHVRCPPEDLERVLADAGPDPAFDMEGFDRAVEERMERPSPREVSGQIVV